MIAALMMAVTVVAIPDASLIHDDDACYTISMTRDGVTKAVGMTRQVIRHTKFKGREALDIKVHQKMGASFDMEDHFIVDGSTLLPIWFENRRNGAVHVTLDYGEDRIKGEKIDANGQRIPIEVKTTDALWEGNLFGVTFAASPLGSGMQFEIPFYQYDKGVGAFTLAVKGEEVVQTPGGPVEAWVLDAGADEKYRAEYLIAKTTRRELGYRSPYGSQSLGGDCAGL